MWQILPKRRRSQFRGIFVASAGLDTFLAVLTGMANPNPSATAAHHQRVDPDHFPGQVHQGTTGVSLVDGCIRLDQTFDLIPTAGIDRPPGSADYTHCSPIEEDNLHFLRAFHHVVVGQDVAFS